MTNKRLSRRQWIKCGLGAAALLPTARIFVAAPQAAAITDFVLVNGKFVDGRGVVGTATTVKNGRIVSAFVSTCRTVYSSNVIDKVIPQVVVRQSPDIDSVSGATQSADAFYQAVSQALAKAK